MSSSSKLILPVLACLFAALTAVGAYIAVPLPGTPMPIILYNLFIMLAGLLLGPRWGLVAVLLYLGLGAVGLPVFSGGTGGLARFMGPGGGYLLGFIPAVLLMGSISRIGGPRWWKDALALFAGASLVYVCGVPWLKMVTGTDWRGALIGGLLPFVPGDLLKILLAVLLAGRLRPLLERALPSPMGENPDQSHA